MTDKQSEDMKRKRYRIRMKRIRDQHKLPHLSREQTDQLIERLMRIPGTVDDIDLRSVVRLFCREMRCQIDGPIYE